MPRTEQRSVRDVKSSSEKLDANRATPYVLNACPEQAGDRTDKFEPGLATLTEDKAISRLSLLKTDAPETEATEPNPLPFRTDKLDVMTELPQTEETLPNLLMLFFASRTLTSCPK